MSQRLKARGRRIPLYLPPDAVEILDGIRRVGEHHRWSRNKTIVELLKRALGPVRRTAAERQRS